MNFDLSDIKFSYKDIKNNIKLPKRLDKKLAYFLGIHIGDGYLMDRPRDYRMSYDSNYINEFEWHHKYLVKLIFELFNRKVTPLRGHNSIQTSFNSKSVHIFLNKICGIPKGPKTNCDIPSIIKNSKPSIQKSFLRGLADTDFSLVFKNRHKPINYYPVIDYQTPNRILMQSVIKLLTSFGFQIYSNKRIQRRNNKPHKSYYFQINGLKAFKKWNKEIGFTNPSQLTKIEVWKKLGYLPPRTNINDRLSLINKKIK